MVFNPRNELFRELKNIQIQNNIQADSNDLQTNFYSLIYEHYPDAIFTLDREGNFLEVSKKAEELIGYKPSELTGHFSSLVKKKNLEHIQKHFVLALKGKMQNDECEVIHKNGHTVHLSITSIPIRKNGEIVGVFGFAKNISELVQNREELIKITNSLNLAQEVAKLGSWDYDTETDLVYCSDFLKDILGINSNQNMVTSYENLLNMICRPEDRDQFDFHFQQIKRNGGKMDLEYKAKRLDDCVITLRLTAEAKKDKDGKVTRIIGIAKDISHLVNTENRLKESEEKFENIAKNLDVGIWSIDCTSNQIVYASPAVEKITGYKLDVLLTEKEWVDQIHPECKKNYYDLQSQLTQGNSLHHQYRIITADGEVKWIEDKTVLVLNTEGKLIRLDGIIQDISEREKRMRKE